MKYIAVFLVLMLAVTTFSAPTSKEDDKVVVTAEFFLEDLAVFTAEHDIVNIFVPINALNFQDDDEDDDANNDSGTTLFFVEADVKDNGEKVYQGLYVLKNGQATKLLDNGRDTAAAHDDTKLVYFGATDGIYVYNDQENKAEKFGSVTDNIISIAITSEETITNQSLYILTEDKQLFKVTDEGKTKVKVDNVKDAQQIVLDSSGNLYYYCSQKMVHVYSDGQVKAIEGLPESPSQITLLRPPFVIEDGVPIIVDSKAYIIYVNGSSELTDFELQAKPSAYSMEATLIQYYAYNKKIYEYNILALMLGSLLEELKEFFDGMKDSIQSIATRSRSDLRAGA